MSLQNKLIFGGIGAVLIIVTVGIAYKPIKKWYDGLWFNQVKDPAVASKKLEDFGKAGMKAADKAIQVIPQKAASIGGAVGKTVADYTVGMTKGIVGGIVQGTGLDKAIEKSKVKQAERKEDRAEKKVIRLEKREDQRKSRVESKAKSKAEIKRTGDAIKQAFTPKNRKR